MMQFRIHTLLVMLASCSLVLAISAGADPPLRIGLFAGVVIIWVGCAFTASAFRSPNTTAATIGMLLLGMLIATTGITVSAWCGGLVLAEHFHTDSTVR